MDEQCSCIWRTANSSVTAHSSPWLSHTHAHTHTHTHREREIQSERVFHNMQHWRATCKRYSLLCFRVKNNGVPLEFCRVLCSWAELMRKRQSHWPALTYYHPCFDFSESIRANADNLINIHEPSSSLILSAFYIVISGIIRSISGIIRRQSWPNG